jgi:hypothetical protein
MSVYTTLAQALLGKTAAADADLSALHKKGLTGPGAADDALVEFDIAMSDEGVSPEVGGRWRRLVGYADQAATSTAEGLIGEIKRLAGAEDAPTGEELTTLVSYIVKVWEKKADVNELPPKEQAVGDAILKPIVEGTPVARSGAGAKVVETGGGRGKPDEPKPPPELPVPTGPTEAQMVAAFRGIYPQFALSAIGNEAWPPLRDQIMDLFRAARHMGGPIGDQAVADIRKLRQDLESATDARPLSVRAAGVQLIICLRAGIDLDTKWGSIHQAGLRGLIGLSATHEPVL